jgi:hypothetical protein
VSLIYTFCSSIQQLIILGWFYIFTFISSITNKHLCARFCLGTSFGISGIYTQEWNHCHMVTPNLLTEKSPNYFTAVVHSSFFSLAVDKGASFLISPHPH